MSAGPITRISPNPPERRWGAKTRQLVDAVRELVAVGEVFTYAMGKDLCGIDLQDEKHLRDSVKVLALEYGIVLKAVPGVGYQRLSEPGKVEKGASDLRSVHRKAGRIQTEQATVQFARLSEVERHAALVQQSLVHHLIEWTAPQRLRELVEARTAPVLPPFDVEAHKDLFVRTP